jgi:hypothetical protein
MRRSAIFKRLIRILPIVSLIVSFGIVYHQHVRRERLKQELAVAEREYAQYEKRYQEASHALQKKKAADKVTKPQ